MRVTTKVVLDIETGAEVAREGYKYDGAVALCRGGQKAAEKQLNVENQWIQQQMAEREAGRKLVLPYAQQLLSSPGYSPEQQAAITQAAMGPLGARFEAAKESAEERAARTRNEAGLREQEDELAREQGRQAANIGAGLQGRFADEKQRRQLEGLQAMANLYGIDTNLLSRTMGLPEQSISLMRGGGFGNAFGAGLGRALGAGLGGLVFG
jgi:hypothetical protein